jgi:histidine ammonia-lyase
MKFLGDNHSTYSDLIDVALFGEQVSIKPAVKKKVQVTRRAVEDMIKRKEIVYGITTGFGAFKNTAIDEDNVRTLQENLIISHAVGVGDPFPQHIVRGMMYLISNYLSKGHSGVRPIIIETIVAMLNEEVTPVVPQKGSVGSSGDLAPSAHLSLVLLGRGEAYYKGQRMPGAKAMKAAGIPTLRLEAKEGLALTNNTSAQTSVACHALYEAKKLIDLGDITGALAVEALHGTTKAFDKRIHEVKAHKGQILTAERLRKLLRGSTMIDNSRTQDQYSIRCMPQIHGAIRMAIAYAEGVINTEVNAVTDNPLIFIDDKGKADIISGGNFHGEPIAIALDSLGIAICEIGNIADRRIATLLDTSTNHGLPGFLIDNGGVNSGMMILQYTTAALVSENKILAHPASVDSIPTSANIEDLVSMGTIAARKALSIADNVKKVLAIELIVNCQAVDFRLANNFKLAKHTQTIHDLVRKDVPFFKKDMEYHAFMEKVEYNIDQDIYAIAI